MDKVRRAEKALPDTDSNINVVDSSFNKQQQMKWKKKTTTNTKLKKTKLDMWS